MEAQLDPSGEEVVLDDVSLRTPGLAGRVKIVYPTDRPKRGETLWGTPELREALANEGVQPQRHVEMTDTEETEEGQAGTHSMRLGKDSIEVKVPAPSRGEEQMLLYEDEAGVTTWELASPEEQEKKPSRGAATRTYVLRRHVPLYKPTGEKRGLDFGVGKKLLTVLAFKLLDPVLGEIGEHFAELWEKRYRPYRLRTFTPDDYNQQEGQPIADRTCWERLAGGRALLLVHGTFSRADEGFGKMDRSLVAKLHERYCGRVFAFDHFTMSHSPQENVNWLLEQIPRDLELNLDIICHSRGGLVSRTLAERQDELPGSGGQVNIHRVIFVATPNAGTPLANDKHMATFIDTYTNLLRFLPANGATETFECVVTVAKLLAASVFKGLEGLRSMDPQGSFLQGLNTESKSSASYYALAGDFEPVEPGWQDWAKDVLMDAIFKDHNDLVVPTAGVFAANGSDRFPIENPFKYGRRDGISHTTFFGEERTGERILEWLR